MVQRVASRALRLALSRQGSALTELAILFPLLWLLSLGAVKMGQTYHAYSAVAEATAQAARYAAVAGGRDASVEEGAGYILSRAGLDPGLASLRVSGSASLSTEAGAGQVPWGGPVYVQVTYPWRLEVAFLGSYDLALGRTLAARSEVN